MKNYIEEAAVTCSDKWYGEKLELIHFENAITNAIYTLQKLDAIKKLLFYGKPIEPALGEPERLPEIHCKYIPRVFEDEQKGVDLIHAVLGIATEAGEMLEALYNAFMTGEPIDETNLKEEGGDNLWYLAILFKALKTNFDDEQRRNIAKLRQRYPEKFSAAAALNRNLAAERVELER